MKKIYTLITAMFLGAGAFAQCFVTITAQTNVTCNGLCNGAATATATGVPPFQYSWSCTTQTTANVNGLCAGTCTVVVVDGAANVCSTTVVITEPAILNDSTQQVNIRACDSCNGTATAFPFGGTAPYTHKWNTTPIQTSATATGLCPGAHTDTITDNNGCKKIQTVTITQAAPLMVTPSVTNTTTSTSCDGGSMANPTGGTAPYTYLWTPGNQTTASIIGQCPGNYSVCVTDAQGCSTCDTSTIIIGVTGISEIAFENTIHISPNPSTGLFTIVCDKPLSNATVVVTNVIGEKVFSSAIKNPKTEINLTNLPKGNYFVKISSVNGSVTKKIVIQ